jgi:hypothetical protein
MVKKVGVLKILLALTLKHVTLIDLPTGLMTIYAFKMGFGNLTIEILTMFDIGIQYAIKYMYM